MNKFTGSDLLKNTCTHRQYYAQAVTPSIIKFVVRIIGAKAILQSTDEYFNDIPLRNWDKLHPVINSRHRLDWHSISTSICIAKEAARQYKEQVEV